MMRKFITFQYIYAASMRSALKGHLAMGTLQCRNLGYSNAIKILDVFYLTLSHVAFCLRYPRIKIFADTCVAVNNSTWK